MYGGGEAVGRCRLIFFAGGTTGGFVTVVRAGEARLIFFAWGGFVGYIGLACRAFRSSSVSEDP